MTLQMYSDQSIFGNKSQKCNPSTPEICDVINLIYSNNGNFAVLG